MVLSSVLSLNTTEQLQAAVIRTLTADGSLTRLLRWTAGTTPRGLSDADPIEIFHELERLREMSPTDSSPARLVRIKEDMHRNVWVNTELCKGEESLSNEALDHARTKPTRKGIVLLF